MASEEVSVQKSSRMEGRKKEKKKSDANVNRNLASWNGVKSWKKVGSEYFVMEGGRSCFPHKHRENVFLKDNEQWQTLAYKDTGMTKDGRWDKQMKKKKKIMHFCNFVYQHDYFAWLSFLQALSWRQGC